MTIPYHRNSLVQSFFQNIIIMFRHIRIITFHLYETFQTNISGTINILQAALVNRGVKKIIVASSDKAYGHNDKLPYREDTSPLRGIYPYEVSKTCA
ncbi:GDP-mannose 4,6-dehydratase, partial [Candidatus Woesearchaeota archaeon]|nr:GDP-mannose 4,6-dehydratase [Candidatus Woesearchaeota archaeon]